jgi:secreted Zn-dependent insulinase-like peptidase
MKEINFTLSPASFHNLISDIADSMVEKFADNAGNSNMFVEYIQSAIDNIVEDPSFVDNNVIERIDFDDITRIITDDIDYYEMAARVSEDISIDDLAESVAENISPERLSTASGLSDYIEEELEKQVETVVANKLESIITKLEAHTDFNNIIVESLGELTSRINDLEKKANRSFFSRIFGG